ncbi:hypothetical protein KSP39_PZI015219 [Platanthera zijinensis]|uniref:Uncharacterized protein n=1 Tax=Platanthera zijinensis TaxID=2320716 RepID=A0AAP0G219_9ASPA
MWLHSHSTCPLCRCSEACVFPTNVLFWGNQKRVKTRGSFSNQSGIRLLCQIHVNASDFTPKSDGCNIRFPSENVKSSAEDAKSPGALKFRSLRSLWSRGK